MLQELNATFCVTAQNNSSDESLYDVLDKIRERPAMFLGEHSLSAMSHFINGFDMARNHETHETPPFEGFNDFVGKFYGKYTTAGWKNLILSDHYGNEDEALTRFYELLDEFRGQELKFNSRDIVLRLLHVSMLDFRGEDDHERQKQIADLLHHVSNGLRTAIYGGLIVWFDSILEDIFERANGNEYLHHWIKSNAPAAAYYEYELWHGFDGSTNITTLIPGNHQQKDYVIDPCEKLIKRFFAMKLEKAKEVKFDFERHKRTIREIETNDYKFLEDFLHLAIFVPEGNSEPNKSVIFQPDLYCYIKDFGKNHDLGFVAESNNIVIGTIWTRLFTEEQKGYGFIDNETPELSMSINVGFRNNGIGTQLLEKMLLKLQESGYRQVSLSVDNRNFAYQLYQKFGFRDIQIQGNTSVMVKILADNAKTPKQTMF